MEKSSPPGDLKETASTVEKRGEVTPRCGILPHALGGRAEAEAVNPTSRKGGEKWGTAALMAESYLKLLIAAASSSFTSKTV